MNAHLRTTYKQGFFLAEENLIKLSDIIQKRQLTADANCRLQFKVYRIDGMLLEFENASDVIAEENSNRNAIKRIEVISNANLCSMKIVFDPLEDTDLAIEAHDRDFAYLLFSDIKEYLNSEILKFRKFSFDSLFSSKNLFPLIMLPFFSSIFFFNKEIPNENIVKQVLDSSDLNQKINFLIENRMSQASPENFKYFLLAAFGFLFFVIFSGNILDKWFPRNIFYWGKAASSYDRLVSLREKILWGILIAFIMGIASTIAVDYFKTK